MPHYDVKKGHNINEAISEERQPINNNQIQYSQVQHLQSYKTPLLSTYDQQNALNSCSNPYEESKMQRENSKGNSSPFQGQKNLQEILDSSPPNLIGPSVNLQNQKTLIVNNVPDEEQDGLDTQRLTSQLAELNLYSSSGSKNFKDSDEGEPRKAKAAKNKKNRLKKKAISRNKKNLGLEEKRIQSIVMSFDFLEDEGEQYHITPRQYSKPLDQMKANSFNFRSFAQNDEITEQSQISDHYSDNKIAINQSIQIADQNEQYASELEFLTKDQVTNFDKLFTFQNKDENDSAKLNVSLKSSEENKILQQNGGNLTQLKSSPLMKSKTYKAPSISPPRKSREKEESDQEELTHNEIILKLLAKLKSEQRSPTKLKVQENLQRNVNFYEEQELNQYQTNNQQPFMKQNQGDVYNLFSMQEQNLPYQTQMYQTQQPFSFQLNPCSKIPHLQMATNNGQMPDLQQLQANVGPFNYGMQMQGLQNQYNGHYGIVNMANKDQFNHGSQLVMNDQRINQAPDQMQIQSQLNDLVYQQQLQLSALANMYNQATLPPILTDLDNQMQQLPLPFQYALITNEQYLQRQFQIAQLLKQQQQQVPASLQFQQPNHHMPYSSNWFITQQQPAMNQMPVLVPNGPLQNINGILQSQPQQQQINEPGLHQAFLAQNQNMCAGLNHFEQANHIQQPYCNVSEFNTGDGSSEKQKEERFNDTIPNLQENRHTMAFESNMKPIGFNLKGHLCNLNQKKSAFSITSKFMKRFTLHDDNEDISYSDEISPPTLYGSPEAQGKAQSIFSESTFQLNCSSSKKQSVKQKSNRLLQMTVNVNQMYDKVSKYKRARQKCLEQIRSNKPQVDYIKTKTDAMNQLQSNQQNIQNVHQNQLVGNLHSQQSNDIIDSNSQQQEQHKLSLYTQEHSFSGINMNNKNDEITQTAINLNDYSGLNKNDNNIQLDDDFFEEKLKWDRKNSKRYQRDQNEEIGLGSGGEYVLKQNQIIISPENERYKIVQYLGQGTFGQVVKCINLAKGTQHAVKIIKNKTEFMLQGMVEIKILEKLNNSPQRTEFEKQHLIKMEDYFVFRDYLCLVFELLQSSLYETIQETERGLNLAKVREYTRQILEALVTCKDANLIHCDLKPENILTAKDGLNVKLIDFGSATFNGHQVYTYIQSRYYRAPEVLMGCQKYRAQNFFGPQLNGHAMPLYDQSIDMWSLACTAIEMFIKIPIFPGKYDYDQLLKILEFCGSPCQQMILNSQNRDRFFYFNPQEQRYVFKTFYDFIVTMVPPGMQDKVEQPINYHSHYNFRSLLESHYLNQLKRDKSQRHMMQQREMAANTKNHCFIPFMFEYTYEEKLQIDQFIDFVQQILQIDQSKRLTPLQALSHPFITGINLPLPFIAQPEVQLKRFRQANLGTQRENNLSHRANFEFQISNRDNLPLPISESQRSISAPLPKRFSVWEFFKNVDQKNGSESFRPPIYALPENIFYGNCCETTISEFYQESKIRFQLHQDENNLAQIDIQKQLLLNHKFCDIEFTSLQDANLNSNKYKDAYGSEDFEIQSNISVLEIQRQKSILQIKEDKNIKQPKVTESEKFIRELLQRDVINFVQIEADRRNQTKIKEEQKQADCDFQFIDDYFKDTRQQKFTSGLKVVKNWEAPSKQPVIRTQSSFDLFEDNALLNQSRRGLILIKKDKERSNSSDTIQKQQSQQPEISLFSKNPIIQEEVHGSNDNISSPISSIQSDQYSNNNIKMPDNLKGNTKFKSQIQQSAASQIERHQNQAKPLIKISKFAEESILDQQSNECIRGKKRSKRSKRQRKKNKNRGQIKTPIKKEDFNEFEDNSLDDKFFPHFGSTKVVECSQPGCHSHCEPFSKHFSKKSSSAFADPECGPSHSGSDFDTEHDTDYGKHQYKKESDNNEGCLTNFKGSTSLRNNTFSNNNSFENPDYLDQLSGSIKEIANNNGGEDEKSAEIGGIRCLRSKRLEKKQKRKGN